MIDLKFPLDAFIQRHRRLLKGFLDGRISGREFNRGIEAVVRAGTLLAIRDAREPISVLAEVRYWDLVEQRVNELFALAEFGRNLAFGPRRHRLEAACDELFARAERLQQVIGYARELQIARSDMLRIECRGGLERNLGPLALRVLESCAAIEAATFHPEQCRERRAQLCMYAGRITDLIRARNRPSFRSNERLRSRVHRWKIPLRGTPQ